MELSKMPFDMIIAVTPIDNIVNLFGLRIEATFVRLKRHCNLVAFFVPHDDNFRLMPWDTAASGYRIACKASL